MLESGGVVVELEALKMLPLLNFTIKEQRAPGNTRSGATSEKKRMEGRARDGRVSGNLIILAHEKKKSGKH